MALVFPLPILVLTVAVVMVAQALARAMGDMAAARGLLWLAIGAIILLAIDAVLLLAALGIKAIDDLSRPD
jgi:hypothetical protein